ncbi:HAD family hydrolase [Methylocapsa palsarum]
MDRRVLLQMSGSAIVAAALPVRGWAQADPLPSWNDGEAKRKIIEFVERVTTPGEAGFAPPAERIATFDNDGTLWSEQPAYFQLLFVLDQIRDLAPQHPEWKTKQPFASALKGDMKTVMAGGARSIAPLLAATHTGMTTEEFSRRVGAWIETARHPATGKLYTEMAYQPMLELLAYFRANGFKTFIVSGGGVEFMRVFAERVYGIAPEQIIGTSGKLKFEIREGKPVMVKLPELFFFDDKEAKPVAIQQQIGRRPLAAFGNSDGDLAMLQWTAAGGGERLPVFIRHTDSVREWAYDRQSKIGKLDKGLDEAAASGWLVVSMKDDWKRIFAFEK